jgi:tetratricopeptide (TPR) repeat protein
MNRTSLLGILLTNYLELAYAADQENKKVWAAKLSDAVYQIEQYLGSKENPKVLQWHGFVDLANGDEDAAIRKLYTAYRQFRASAKVVNGRYYNPDLRYPSYLLARLFAGKQEIGLYRQFLEDAFTNGVVQIAPWAMLDYSESLIQSKQYKAVISIVDRYKEVFGDTFRADSLLVRAHQRSGEYDKAVELLSTMDPDASETMKLKIQLFNRRIARMVIALKQETSEPEQESFTQEEIDKLHKERVAVLEKLMASDPANAETPISVATYSMKHKQLKEAKKIMDMYISAKKTEGKVDSTLIQAKTFRMRLQEPDPVNVSEERLGDIMLDVILEISDPKQKIFFLHHSTMQRRVRKKRMSISIRPMKLTPMTPHWYDNCLMQLCCLRIRNL